MNALTKDLSVSLTKAGISNKIDISSAKIGRRYARVDEVGIPFAVTVDFQTIDASHVLYNVSVLECALAKLP